MFLTMRQNQLGERLMNAASNEGPPKIVEIHSGLRIRGKFNMPVASTGLNSGRGILIKENEVLILIISTIHLPLPSKIFNSHG